MPPYFVKKLKRAGSAFVLSALFFFSLWAYPVEARFPCAPAKAVMQANFASGYALLATAVMNGKAVIQLYISREGEWRMIGVDNNLDACVLMAGTDWSFAFGERI